MTHDLLSAARDALAQVAIDIADWEDSALLDHVMGVLTRLDAELAKPEPRVSAEMWRRLCESQNDLLNMQMPSAELARETAEPVAARYRYRPAGKWHVCDIPTADDPI